MEFSTSATQRSSSSEALVIQPGSVRSPAADAANDFARHLAENASQRTDRRDDRPAEWRERSTAPERAEKREEAPRTRETSNKSRNRGEDISSDGGEADTTTAMSNNTTSQATDVPSEQISAGEDKATPAEEAVRGDVPADEPAEDDTNKVEGEENSDTAVAAVVPVENTSIQTAAATTLTNTPAKVASDSAQQQASASASNKGAAEGAITGVPAGEGATPPASAGETQPKKPVQARNGAQVPVGQTQTSADASGNLPAAETEAKEPSSVKVEKGLGQEAAEKLAEKKSGDKQITAQANATAMQTANHQTTSRHTAPTPQTTQLAAPLASSPPSNGEQVLPAQQANGGGSATTIRIGTLPGQSQPTQIPANTIALQMARNLQKGTNRFDIRLDPPEMGRIDVRMEVRKDGHVVAHMSVDRPETLDLLQRDARALQQALNNAGLQADSDSLNFSLRDQNGDSGTRDFANGSNGSSSIAGEDTDVETSATPIYNINLAANGGVDIRV